MRPPVYVLQREHPQIVACFVDLPSARPRALIRFTVDDLFAYHSINIYFVNVNPITIKSHTKTKQKQLEST